jgi:hypothetical protein
MNEAVDASTEGLIVKTLGDTYELNMLALCPYELVTPTRHASYALLALCMPHFMCAACACLTLLQAFLNEAVDASTEGLIVKTLGDTYEPNMLGLCPYKLVVPTQHVYIHVCCLRCICLTSRLLIALCMPHSCRRS